MDLRELYKNMPLAHIVSSSDIASASVCPWRFKLPRFIGVQPSGTDSSPLIGRITHEVLSELLLDDSPILDLWKRNYSNPQKCYNALTKESESYVEQIIIENLDAFNIQDETKRKEFFDAINDRVAVLLLGFVRGFVTRETPPKRILTELQITNVRAGQMGIIDVFMEHPNGSYTVLDWKTYGFNKPSSWRYDHFQVVVNGLLANFRMGMNECDFSRCRLSVAYSGGVYFPNPPSQTLLTKVLEARKYALACLAGGSPRGSLPPEQVCWQCRYVSSCTFFRREQMLSMNNELPMWYRRIRNELWWRRWVVLGVRAVSHKTAIMVEEALSHFGRKKGIEELKRIGILDEGYSVVGYDPAKRILTLKKDYGICPFGKRATVSVIALEGPDVHPLACVKTRGSVWKVDNSNVEIMIYGDNLRRRANQFRGLPLLILRDEIDLTSRELESLSFVHQLIGNLLFRGESDALPRY